MEKANDTSLTGAANGVQVRKYTFLKVFLFAVLIVSIVLFFTIIA